MIKIYNVNEARNTILKRDYNSSNEKSRSEDITPEEIVKTIVKDVEKRIADFIHSLTMNFQDKHVALVAHKAPQLALDVLLKNKSWEQAIDEDWRKEKKWQPEPNTEIVARKVLSLPMYPELRENQVQFVIDSIKEHLS